MRINKNKSNCSGCTACFNICPRQAIKMHPDNLGFLYPSIDDNLCIDCGLCEKVCSFSINYKRYSSFSEPKVFAMRSKDLQELSKSQSGAAFFEFAKKHIIDGGVVYGAAMDNSFEVIHIRVSSIQELDRLRLSKYTQSRLNDIFKRVRKDLQDGLNVLFSGTPCQISGLNSYIQEYLKINLTTIDLVCHGVPSPFVWKEYLTYNETKYGKIKKCVFRDKKYGWNCHIESFYYKSGINKKSHIFKDLFYENLMLRYSCYSCPFTNLKRCSDITIGDFWGWSKISHEFNDNLGLSLVLLNSEKGESFFKLIEPNIEYRESNIVDCLQPQLKEPSYMHPKRDDFEVDFVNRGFEYVAKKYGALGYQYALKKLKRLYWTILKIFNLA